ncbi:MAG: PIG-L family deacetylase [Elusimicrobia bacterium]|nr:PIG-L family deacetylase [Elusimicrobiota bacterium]
MKILGIGSHPDDLEFGCGGTFYKLSRAGHQVHLLIMTSGEVGGDSKTRRAEQEKSAKILGAKVFWGGFRDTDIPLTRELIDTIESHVRKIKPDIIFTQYFEDTHQDHRKVSQATTTATRYNRNVLFYEVPTSMNFTPTVFVDIGSVLNQKLAVLKAHRSQVYQTRVPKLSILESAKSTAIFRGYQDRIKYAEAFLPLRLTLDLNL